MTLSATEALRRIHAHLVVPYEWDSGTCEGVDQILAQAGYVMPPGPIEEDGEEIDDISVNDPRLDPYRPAKETT